MSTRAAIYARFSTDKQKVASIDDQVRECERVAKSHGLELVARFEDRGISAGTADRPGYQALLTAARAGKFDFIVTEDVSRLWRNRAEFGPRSAELEDLGVHWISCVGDDTRRGGWGLTVQIKQAMAEQARLEASYRTRRGLEGRALAGESTGGRAFGYIPARDTKRKRLEIDAAEAAIVRRIFELYADGASPRNIAAQLNAEGVPSPGARWKRTTRRTDCKWLSSAIHGDVTRGTGILNNRRYLGNIIWGRSEWKRSAADSAKRRHKMLEIGKAHEHVDERLRIVSDELWERVKARQKLRSHDAGVRVKTGLRRHVRPSKYLLSSLLRCAACESSFVLSNGSCYQCATHVNGHACDVTLSLPRERAERVVLSYIENCLLNPARLTELEERYRSAAARPAIDHSRRITELDGEIRHIGDAIAQGMVSESLASRLQASEAERGRLITAQKSPPTAARMQSSTTLEGRAAMMRKRLAQGGDIARAAVRDLIPDSIWLDRDSSGRFLWACFADGVGTALLDQEVTPDSFPIVTESACVVAGVGFEPTTFGL